MTTDTAAPSSVAGAPLTEEQVVANLRTKPLLRRYLGYVSLSGPGWLQSALTLGGGTLASSMYLGVLTGYSMLWVQPLAMILGIIMLSSISYVTLNTQQRPFRQINRYVNPVLGWGWLIASLMANIVWCLPQYALAVGVIRKNLLPDVFGASTPLAGDGGTWILVLSMLVICTLVTWSYGGGGWGIRLYEATLKIVVGLIVLCFVGVVARLIMDGRISWGAIGQGLIPDFTSLFRPAATFDGLLTAIDETHRGDWANYIVFQQRDVAMSGFATAVGINMTFLLPYSLLARKWTKNYSELAVFDLSTGMFIPYLLSTTCVVVAAASQFHAVAPEPAKMSVAQVQEQESILLKVARQRALASNPTASEADVTAARSAMQDSEAKLAATLVTRDVDALAAALEPLCGEFLARVVFGVGVLGMALSTISLLMLVSGFVFCEVLDVPARGTAFRFGTMAAATGIFGPLLWKHAAAWLAIPTSVIGLMLLPLAYVAFFGLMNSRRVLGSAMLQGGQRVVVNLLMGVATLIAIVAGVWAVWGKTGWLGIGIWTLIVAAVLLTRVTSGSAQPEEAPAAQE